MIYIDTSVLVALFTNEAMAGSIAHWYAMETDTLVSGDWCMTEFASALMLKQRTGQLTRRQANAAWKAFDEFCTGALRLVPIERSVFTQAARLVRTSTHGLRAGDALHLALALYLKADAFFTLDSILGASAKHVRLSVTTLKRV